MDNTGHNKNAGILPTHSWESWFSYDSDPLICTGFLWMHYSGQKHTLKVYSFATLQNIDEYITILQYNTTQMYKNYVSVISESYNCADIKASLNTTLVYL